MSPQEWREIAKRVIAKWPHQPPPPASLAESFNALSDLDAGQVMAAVESFYRDGREWPPTGGMLRQRVVELQLDAPEWAEALKWLKRYAQTGTINPAYGSREIYRAKGAGVLAAMPARVAEFVEALGDRQLWEASEQDGGGEARLREKWLAHSRRQQREGALAGLPDSGLATLERVNGDYQRLVADTLREMPALGRSD